MDMEKLDYVTRVRMKTEERNDFLFYLVITVFIFLGGMVLGSALHDSIFHALEHRTVQHDIELK